MRCGVRAHKLITHSVPDLEKHNPARQAEITVAVEELADLLVRLRPAARARILQHLSTLLRSPNGIEELLGDAVREREQAEAATQNAEFEAANPARHRFVVTEILKLGAAGNQVDGHRKRVWAKRAELLAADKDLAARVKAATKAEKAVLTAGLAEAVPVPRCAPPETAGFPTPTARPRELAGVRIGVPDPEPVPDLEETAWDFDGMRPA